MEFCGKGVYEGTRKKHAWSRLVLQQENPGRVGSTTDIKVKGLIQVQASRVDFARPNWTQWRSRETTTTTPRKGARGVGQTVQKAQRVKRKMQITLHSRVTCRGAGVGVTVACEAQGYPCLWGLVAKFTCETAWRVLLWFLPSNPSSVKLLLWFGRHHRQHFLKILPC